MSGTSADGVDAALVVFERERFAGVEASFHLPPPPSLRERLVALGRDAEAAIRLAELASLDQAIAERFAEAALGVLGVAGLPASAIRAIGSHGQTVFHDPDGIGSSLQLGDPNRIAARTGITVVADFRRMDVAHGGQGAPLVPAFHAAVFGGGEATAVVNIGGIANITWLPSASGEPVRGHDCGPGNALMDEWALRHLGTPYDADGAFAASGSAQPALLDAWLAHPYFRTPPPKSTGRGLFRLEWAEAQAACRLDALPAADVQASFAELTARAIAQDVPDRATRLLLCGGGAFNGHLRTRIAALLPRCTVGTTAEAGLDPQWVEAAAFAWLARQRLHGQAGNLPAVTGAHQRVLLGGLYTPLPEAPRP
jgi:anhydro-N-acetylmuramic acid kinase